MNVPSHAGFARIAALALSCVIVGLSAAPPAGAANERPKPGECRIDLDDYQGQAEIHGLMKWSTGLPAAEVTFDLIAYSHEDEQVKVGEATTDAEGRYAIKGLRGKTARYRLFQTDDDRQRTFYILVGRPDARTTYDWTLQPRVGDPAPEHVMPDLDGRPVDLKEFLGKIVILKFWASWCGPCHAQMRETAELMRKHPEWRDNVVVIAVNADETKEAAQTFIAENKLGGMIHLFESGPRLASTRKRAFRVGSIPFTFVLDRTGVVRYRNESSEGVAVLVEALFKAPTTPTSEFP